MRFHVGTSGYSYKEWKGTFYPEKLPQKEMLSYYAQHISTVEVNYTFRQLPNESVVESWTQQVPESFRFVLKAPQVITHFKRLQNAEKETDDLLRIASVLKQRRGPILFQLPPNFKKNLPRLEAFLGHVGGPASLAFEFRHESWFEDDVLDCLRAHSSALCFADGDNLPGSHLIRTAKWGYVRLRHEGYTDEHLREWIQRFRAQYWDEAYVFFKHEDAGAGPKMATRFVGDKKETKRGQNYLVAALLRNINPPILGQLPALAAGQKFLWNLAALGCHWLRQCSSRHTLAANRIFQFFSVSISSASLVLA